MFTEFHKKQNFLNKFFAAQCTLVINLSWFTPFKMRANKLIENVTINEDDITRIAKNLNPSKSHVWDNLSIRMISGQSISGQKSMVSPSLVY